MAGVHPGGCRRWPGKAVPGGEPEVQPAYVAWDREGQGYRCAGDGRHGVACQQGPRSPAVAAGQRGDRAGIEAIGEVVVMTAMATTAAAVMPVVAGQIRTICAR
jgi:hypothetical protein